MHLLLLMLMGVYEKGAEAVYFFSRHNDISCEGTECSTFLSAGPPLFSSSG